MNLGGKHTTMNAQKKPPLVKCDRCGKSWDTLNPCALCNATHAYPTMRL